MLDNFFRDVPTNFEFGHDGNQGRRENLTALRSPGREFSGRFSVAMWTIITVFSFLEKWCHGSPNDFDLRHVREYD